LRGARLIRLVTRHDIRTMSTDQTSPWVTKEGVEVKKKIGQSGVISTTHAGPCIQVVEFGTNHLVGKVRVQAMA